MSFSRDAETFFRARLISLFDGRSPRLLTTKEKPQAGLSPATYPQLWLLHAVLHDDVGVGGAGSAAGGSSLH